MDQTANLKLPYILAAQSQKHVTHNEALRALDAIVQLAVQDKDLSAPPGAPAEGARYIVGASPTGTWSGHATHVAAWQDGAWAFYVPRAGWLAWVDDESQSYLFAGGGWIPAPGGGGASLVPKGAWSSVATYTTGDLVEHEGYAFLSNIDDNLDNEPDAETPGSTSEWTYFAVVTGGGGGGGGEGSVNPVSLVGVNATADTTNRLSVSSPASLFSHDGAGHQLKVNKDAADDTASVLFQTNFSGRAEFGLAGDDDFHVKVSPDGSVWHEAIVINRSNGVVRATGLREILAANRTYYVRTDGSDSNTGLANTSGDAWATLQRAWTEILKLDLAGFAVTVQVGNGTYAAGLGTSTGWFTGTGSVTFLGDEITPSNVTISLSSGNCSHFQTSGGGIGPVRVRGFKIQTSSGIGINNAGSGLVQYQNVEFGACTTAHVWCDVGGTIQCTGPYTITGGANRHLNAANGSRIINTNASLVTISGTMSFGTAFAQALSGSLIVWPTAPTGGTVTGKRFDCNLNSVIAVNGGGASHFPGNSAGTTATGGQCA